MPHRKALASLVVGVILAVAVPTAASLYLAHRYSMNEQSAEASAVALEVLRRADLLGAASDDAYTLLKTDPNPPCSAAKVKLMRSVDVSSGYLKATGYVDGNRLKCSSLGSDGDAIDLGPVTYITDVGVRVRANVDLGLGGDKRYMVIEYGGYATALQADYLVDLGVLGQDLALGAFSASSGTIIGSRGPFDPTWIAKLGSASQATFFDGRFLVEMRRSSSYNVVSYAAVPARLLKTKMRSALFLLVPLGLALGGVLAAGVLWLARYQASLPSVLRSALKRKQFVLHYQPIVRLSDSRIVGLEALLRWNRRDGFAIRPDVFIPVAEECGLIQKFTKLVVDQLALDIPVILKARPHTYISLNLSSYDLRSKDVVVLLKGLLDSTGIPPSSLVVEATEHSFIGPDVSQATIDQIRKLGIRVAIDDFGTGYSSLSYLGHLKSDFLKIDRTFIEAVGTQSATSEVALHILQIAKTLHMRVVAEGVETKLQAKFLRENGAEFAQGWLFGRPMPLAEVLHFNHGH